MKTYRFNSELNHQREKFVVKTENDSFAETFLKAFKGLDKDHIEVFPDNGGIEFTVEVTYPDGVKKSFRSYLVGEMLTEPKIFIYQFDEIN